jgi:alpha-methylacyl-CoA racemase
VGSIGAGEVDVAAQGPLGGIEVVEVAGMGAGPFCAMLLADLGARVTRIDRIDDPVDEPILLGRGRRSIALDLKDPAGIEVLLGLTDRSDVLIEGFRPGVAERLGFGPEVCRARNERLVYGRMTGFGQTGSWRGAAGHDLNYIGLAGAAWNIGSLERPIPPLNLVGDFGGGAFLLAFGVAGALFERERSGQGQVVDAAMVDGASLLMTMFHEMLGRGMWQEARASNLVDGGTWYYDVYETADGEWISCAAVEEQFRRSLLRELGFAEAEVDAAAGDPSIRRRLADVIKTKTRAEWEGLFVGRDACVAPVLRLTEMWDHPYHTERQTSVELNGIRQPAPAPRFSRTPPGPPSEAPCSGAHTTEVLFELGFDERAVGALLDRGVVRQG